MAAASIRPASQSRLRPLVVFNRRDLFQLENIVAGYRQSEGQLAVHLSASQ